MANTVYKGYTISEVDHGHHTQSIVFIPNSNTHISFADTTSAENFVDNAIAKQTANTTAANTTVANTAANTVVANTTPANTAPANTTVSNTAVANTGPHEHPGQPEGHGRH